MKIRWHMVAIAIVVIYAASHISPAGAQSAFSHEYRIKAVFIYQFINFVDGWKFQQENSKGNENKENRGKPILLGIIGEDPFHDAFEPLKDKRVKGSKVTIKYFKGLSELNSQDEKVELHPKIKDIKQCDLIFVCSSEEQYICNILEPIRNDSILTIADTQGFLEKGGIINFVIERNKVRFEVNAVAARRAKLTIRAKLLRLAKRVLEKDDLGEK